MRLLPAFSHSYWLRLHENVFVTRATEPPYGRKTRDRTTIRSRNARPNHHTVAKHATEPPYGRKMRDRTSMRSRWIVHSNLSDKPGPDQYSSRRATPSVKQSSNPRNQAPSQDILYKYRPSCGMIRSLDYDFNHGRVLGFHRL